MSDSSSISSVFSAAPSAIGSCALSGEGESIFEGVYAIRARLAGKVRSMAEAYGWRLVCSARAARGNAGLCAAARPGRGSEDGRARLTAGLLTVAAVEDVIVEAHESAQATRGSVLSVVGGFVLFTLVSAGWGGQTSGGRSKSAPDAGTPLAPAPLAQRPALLTHVNASQCSRWDEEQECG